MKFVILLAALLCATQTVQAKTIELSTRNTVNFRGEVSATSVTRVSLELLVKVAKRGRSSYPIYIVLNSPGGSIMSGLGFIELLNSLKNVHTISIFAASMASAIAQANPGTRYVIPSGIVMFHRAKGQFQGQFENGEVEQQLALFKEVVLKMERTNAARMCLSLDSYKNKVKDEYWLFGENAVKAKAADELVSLSCSEDLINARESSTEVGFFGVSKISYSSCPLLQDPVSAPAEGE